MSTKYLAGWSFAALMLICGSVQGALFDRGGGLIYDDVLNVTWLQDTSYGAGSPYDDGHSDNDGAMTWANAVAWADSLVFYDSVRNVTYNDWRLPRVWFAPWAGGNCFGFNCVNSEMGSLYYLTLGRRAMPENALPAPDMFVNFQNYDYWTSTIFWSPDGRSWIFGMEDGGQVAIDQNRDFLVWAVRDGDVATVPEPESKALLLFGIALIAVFNGKKNLSE